jgi:preprotein translocase subunit SecA
LRGYAQQDPLNEFRREAFRLYEELRDLIRHGVASTIFRVTVTHGPAQSGNGADPAVASSLARGAAAIRGGAMAGAPSAPGAAGAAAGRSSGGGGGVTVAAATGGGATRVLSGGAAVGPVARPIRESLGEQVISAPGGGAGGTTDGARPGYTPTGERIGRNDPCWCGSGVKYKKCHGR